MTVSDLIKNKILIVNKNSKYHVDIIDKHLCFQDCENITINITSHYKYISIRRGKNIHIENMIVDNLTLDKTTFTTNKCISPLSTSIGDIDKVDISHFIGTHSLNLYNVGYAFTSTDHAINFEDVNLYESYLDIKNINIKELTIKYNKFINLYKYYRSVDKIIIDHCKNIFSHKK